MYYNANFEKDCFRRHLHHVQNWPSTVQTSSQTDGETHTLILKHLIYQGHCLCPHTPF